MGTLKVIVGGQYGSEAKGTIAAHLARTSTNKRLMAIRVAGPNAGHTVYGDDGIAWPLRSVPVAAVARPDALLAIAAGSEIDEPVLDQEIAQLRMAGYPTNLIIDAQATVLDHRHHNEEKERNMHDLLGSTGKGVGAARAARLMRDADLYGGNDCVLDRTLAHLRRGGEVHIEGTQGYGLGLHAGAYPYCTSSDCRAIDFLGMVGISPWAQEVDDLEVWITVRTYPIRVAGNSGPLYNELTFDQLSRRLGEFIEPEKTTVTKKVRRIGEWNIGQVHRAIYHNGGREMVRVALTFADYLHRGAYECKQYDELPAVVTNWIEKQEQELGVRFDLITTGPETIIDRRTDT
jgi:adenylosuccinate synthase